MNVRAFIGCRRWAPLALLILVRVAIAAEPRPATPIDFQKQILPIFERACVTCHGEGKASAGLRLHTGSAIRQGGVSGKAVLPGHGADSTLVKRLRGQGGEDRMPDEGDPLPETDIALIRAWIDEGAVVPREVQAPFSPTPAGMRRLSITQYHHAIRDLLGIETSLALEADDTTATRFAPIASYRVTTSQAGVEKYLESALLAPKTVFADPSRREDLVGCSPRRASDPCVGRFLARFGLRAWRRPLAEPELARYARIVKQVAAANRGDVWKGLALAVSAFLQSPNFLYAGEVGEPDAARPGWRRFTGYEMATRLALLLWDAIPDIELLQAAADDRLSTVAGIRGEAKRMLASPRAKAGVRRFFSEHFDLAELGRLGKSKDDFPQATGTLAAAMAEEIHRVVERLVFDTDADVLEFLTSRETFVDAELAKLYGLPDADAIKGPTPVTLTEDSPRVGFLGMGAFLAVNASTTRTSPTRRGVFIRERLLCQEVPPPPPDVNTDIDEVEDQKKLEAGKAYKATDTRTMRQRMSAHATNPTCANCHAFFDPLGFSLEEFDGLGAYRTHEHGQRLDLSGKLDDATYTGTRALAALLHKDPRTAACLVRETYQYATGHAVTVGEELAVSDLVRRFEAQGRRFKQLLVDVVTSDGFRYFARRKSPGGPVATKAPAPARRGRGQIR